MVAWPGGERVANPNAPYTTRSTEAMRHVNERGVPRAPKRLRSIVGVAALGGLVFGAAGVARADNLIADGDAATASVQNLNLGTVCAGENSDAGTVTLWITRNGSYGGPQVFEGGAPIAV